jgi:tetratricopeptide (TPR) repeat protein
MNPLTVPRPAWRLVLALAAGVILVYLPTLGAGFIWDDDVFITRNPRMGSFEGLLRAWIPGDTSQYYPVVYSAFWIEHALFGLEPGGYHALNIAFHALNAILVWRLCLALGIPGAWFVGALFGLHPVHVESVAWISERKNLLCAFFYLLSALAYLRFAEQLERGSTGTNRLRTLGCYLVALLCFGLALLSKTVACSLPVALILMRLWQRKPLKGRALLPLVPFFGLGLVLGLQAVHLERELGASGPGFDFDFGQRIQICGDALLFYARKLFLPWPLMLIYPRIQPDAAELALYWPLPVLAALALGVLAAWRRGTRGPALACAYFAVTIFPALGFFDVYLMIHTFVADHHVYLASLGPLALAAAGATRLPATALTRGLGAAVLVICGLLTWRHGEAFTDADTLWRVTARRNPEAWAAYNNLGKAALERGEPEEGLRLLEQALKHVTHAPSARDLRYNRAIALGRVGRYQDSLAELESLQSSGGGLEIHLARALERLGREVEAEQLYRQALAGPLRADALHGYGLHLLRLGRPAEAVPLLEELARARPSDLDVLMFLSDACSAAGRLQAAVEAAERARELALGQGRAETARRIGQRLEQYRSGGTPR